MIGLPARVANGTNRVGVLVQSMVARLRKACRASRNRWVLFATLRRRRALAVVDDATFERLFGIVMLLRPSVAAAHDQLRRRKVGVSSS